MAWLKKIPGFVIGAAVLVVSVIVITMVYQRDLNTVIEHRKAMGVWQEPGDQ